MKLGHWLQGHRSGKVILKSHYSGEAIFLVIEITLSCKIVPGALSS